MSVARELLVNFAAGCVVALLTAGIALAAVTIVVVSVLPVWVMLRWL